MSPLNKTRRKVALFLFPLRCSRLFAMKSAPTLLWWGQRILGVLLLMTQKAEGTQPVPRASCGSVQASDRPSSIIFGGQHPLRPRACLPLSPSSAEMQGIWVRPLINLNSASACPEARTLRRSASSSKMATQSSGNKFHSSLDGKLRGGGLCKRCLCPSCLRRVAAGDDGS